MFFDGNVAEMGEEEGLEFFKIETIGDFDKFEE